MQAWQSIFLCISVYFDLFQVLGTAISISAVTTNIWNVLCCFENDSFFCFSCFGMLQDSAITTSSYSNYSKHCPTIQRGPGGFIQSTAWPFVPARLCNAKGPNEWMRFEQFDQAVFDLTNIYIFMCVLGGGII